MRQRGMSFFGLIFIIAAIGMVVSLGIKIIPAYLDFYTVSEAVADTLKQPRIALSRNDEILKKIKTQLSINNIEMSMLGKDAITISREDGSLAVEIDYVVEEVVSEREDSTLSIVMAFNKVHEVDEK